MRLSFALCLFLLIAACASSGSAVSTSLSIGDALPSDAEVGGTLPTDVLPELEGLRPFEVTREAVTFSVGADADGRVRYVATADTAFETPEGIGTQTRLVDLIRSAVGSGIASPDISILPDGRSVYELRSGWRAVVPDPDRLRAAGTEARVEWVYLR